MTIQQQIKESVDNYINSNDKERLLSSYNSLMSCLSNKFINEENYNNAAIFSFCVYAKYTLICFKDRSFSPFAEEEYRADLEKKFLNANSLGFKQAMTVLKSSMDLIQFLGKTFKDYASYRSEVFDDEDNIILTSTTTANKIMDYTQNSIKALEEYDNYNPFLGVKFINLKEFCIHLMKVLYEKTSEVSKSLSYKNLKEVFQKNVSMLSDEIKNQYEYFPNIGLRDNINNFVVVFNPFEIEVKLAAYYYGLIHNKEFAVLNLDSVKIDNFEVLFDSLKLSDYEVLVLNAFTLPKDKYEAFFKACFRYSKDHMVFVHNKYGDITPYESLLAFGKSLEVDFYSMNRCYLPFPKYKDVIDLFKEKKIIEEDTDHKIRDSFKFISYFDLNIIFLKYLDKNYLDIANQKSYENYKKILGYLSYLPSQIQLIDIEYGEVSAGAHFNNIKPVEYDYDSIREVSRDNILKILNHDLRLEQKIGVLTKYILLAGEDISTYKYIDEDTLKDRITLATKLIYVAYKMNYLPEVEFVKNSESWLGRCCNGGAIIQYKLDKLKKDYDDTFDTICHETRHAFQSFLADNYNSSFKAIYGISQNVVKFWAENNTPANYQKNDENFKAYYYQVIEVDAKAFALDCLDGANEAYNLIDFR